MLVIDRLYAAADYVYAEGWRRTDGLDDQGGWTIGLSKRAYREGDNGVVRNESSKYLLRADRRSSAVVRCVDLVRMG